jgi:hypothetical protein
LGKICDSACFRRIDFENIARDAFELRVSENDVLQCGALNFADVLRTVGTLVPKLVSHSYILEGLGDDCGSKDA